MAAPMVISRFLIKGIAIAGLLLASSAAQAGGRNTVHKYVHKTGRCGSGQEVMASYYSSGRRTANGEKFDANGNTAAARTYAMGTRLVVRNPHNGRSVAIRINDKGPWGRAYAAGVKLDLARGAAKRIGMNATSYVCVMHA